MGVSSFNTFFRRYCSNTTIIYYSTKTMKRKIQLLLSPLLYTFPDLSHPQMALPERWTFYVYCYCKSAAISKKSSLIMTNYDTLTIYYYYYTLLFNYPLSVAPARISLCPLSPPSILYEPSNSLKMH